MTENNLTAKEKAELSARQTSLSPTAEEISVLSPIEKIGFRLTHKMNHGAWKRFWTFCQRHIGSLWIKISTYNLMNVFGLENFEQTDPTRPILLVANHRSFFDMYVVSTTLFRHTDRKFNLYFPVRAKFFYDSPVGWLVNLIMGWFSMYPPFFREEKVAEKREFDKYSMRELVRICSENKSNVIGFHPEGKRNLSDDPYTFAARPARSRRGHQKGKTAGRSGFYRRTRKRFAETGFGKLDRWRTSSHLVRCAD